MGLNPTLDYAKSAAAEAVQMLDEGLPRHKVLTHLALAAEKIYNDGSVSSILVLDKEGLLRNGASPGLPYDYLTAIDGLKPNPNVGTCCVAAATGNVVVTPDFRSDDKWAELRHLPLALGFTSAWSVPIKNSQGMVLGTFGTYFRAARKPSDSEMDDINFLASAAGQVLSVI